MKTLKVMLVLILIALGVFSVYHWVRASSNCTWTYVNGQYTCVINGSDGGSGTNGGGTNGGSTNGGSNNGGSNNGGSNNGGSNNGSGNGQACIPSGQATYGYVWLPLNYSIDGVQQCERHQAFFDSCGNVIKWSIQQMGDEMAACTNSSSTQTPPSSNSGGNSGNTPATCSLDGSNGSISCSWNFQWKLEASVTMPPIVIDTRPYPVTLVNWPTTMRVNSLATNNGSGSLAYAGWGGGAPDNPQPGDWKNITLTLTFAPTGNPVTVSLSKQSAFTVSASAGGTKTFTWTVASHPAVGAVKTAGQVGQLSEIPGDTTLFQGNSMTTYNLSYKLTYQEYSQHYVCLVKATAVASLPGQSPAPAAPCVIGKYVGQWDSKSESGNIPPSAVQNLPASINGGSVYNDYSVVIRRMDDNGSTSNPAYAHQYSWGSIYYWGVREGEGQEGWPSQ